MKTFNAKARRRKDATQNTEVILDCGGKRSATPLWNGESHPLFERRASCESGVAAALCHRTPKPLRLCAFASLR
jgi:hypothetical protein